MNNSLVLYECCVWISSKCLVFLRSADDCWLSCLLYVSRCFCVSSVLRLDCSLLFVCSSRRCRIMVVLLCSLFSKWIEVGILDEWFYFCVSAIYTKIIRFIYFAILSVKIKLFAILSVKINFSTPRIRDYNILFTSSLLINYF